LQSTGKKLLDAVTWGTSAFETGAGVAVSGTTVVLGASTIPARRYSLLAAAAKLSAREARLAASERRTRRAAGPRLESLLRRRVAERKHDVQR
jgi:hypothetical protein